jgi:hypothetical protein
MNRRAFLKTMAFALASMGSVSSAGAQLRNVMFHTDILERDAHIRDYLQKMKNFNRPYQGDVFIDDADRAVFSSTVDRLRRVESFLGHGNFQVVGFDDAVKFSREFSAVGPFTPSELAFLEKIFYEDARNYGFLGEKTIQKITDCIDERGVTKVPDSGNFIFKGQSLLTYDTIKKKIGDEVVLTSGVRGVMKQFLLFLNKADSSRGNLSLASRSLAPPGYSFHGNGDFDVGQVELGSDNFTERFAQTRVYEKLCDLGYLKLRYPVNNLLGVRFEPWHIKVT